MTIKLDNDTVLRRVNGIQQEIAELEKLALIPFDEFKSGVGFKLAQFHLHRALEGVFHIAAHLLARIPGGQASGYKEMAKKCGEYGIVPKDFAASTLEKMAGYRNRLVHFYAEISLEEMHDLISKHRGDFNIFLKGVKNVLEHPEKFGIGIK